MLTFLSAKALKERFFQVIKSITHEMLIKLCNIDYNREMAMVAEVRENGSRKIIGIAGLVAGFGIPISIGVGIYTGVLLGSLTARPFWNNPMLPMLFLISAMMTGSASMCFVGCFIQGFRGMSRENINTNKSRIERRERWR
jgi:formate-dependent nitrite reductase membrane component NrfD